VGEPGSRESRGAGRAGERGEQGSRGREEGKTIPEGVFVSLPQAGVTIPIGLASTILPINDNDHCPNLGSV